MRGLSNTIFIFLHRSLCIGLQSNSSISGATSSYLFYDRDVFDLFFLFMSVEKMETRVKWGEVEVLRRSALTSRPTALQTRFSRCSEASVRDEGRRSPRMEEGKTPSLLFVLRCCSEGPNGEFNLRKFVSPLLWKRRRRRQERARSLSASVYYGMITVQDVERKIDHSSWLNF